MAVDTSFLAAFANQPVSLIILGIVSIIGLWIWKGMPKVLLKSNDDIRSNIKSIQTDVTSMKKDIAHLKQSDKNQTSAIVGLTLDGLKAFVKNETIPLSERYFACFRYFDLGGNGAIKDFIDTELSKRDQKLYESIRNIYENKKIAIKMKEQAIISGD
jgi:hypothetical protein